MIKWFSKEKQNSGCWSQAHKYHTTYDELLLFSNNYMWITTTLTIARTTHPVYGAQSISFKSLLQSLRNKIARAKKNSILSCLPVTCKPLQDRFVRMQFLLLGKLQANEKSKLNISCFENCDQSNFIGSRKKFKIGPLCYFFLEKSRKLEQSRYHKFALITSM